MGLNLYAPYIFVAWLPNMGNWVYGALEKGFEYVISYPVNALLFSQQLWDCCWLSIVRIL